MEKNFELCPRENLWQEKLHVELVWIVYARFIRQGLNTC